MKSAIDYIASNLNINSTEPDKELAERIVKDNLVEWVKELVDNLNSKNKRVQSDCIKTLYEIGENGGANLISTYATEFLALLNSKNNRLVWGAMTAIDASLNESNQDYIFENINLIVSAIKTGSVIATDHAVSILSKLGANSKYARASFPLLFEQLSKCPAKQLPMYAEFALIALNSGNKNDFIELLENRKKELERDSQIKRIDKAIKKANQL